MAGQWVRIENAAGGAFRGYLAVPASGSGPGIVLLQEIFGVTEHIRDMAEEYAADGYEVLAPALFDREQPGFEADYGGDG